MMMMNLNIANTGSGFNAGNTANVKPRQTASVSAKKQTTAQTSATNPRQTMEVSEDALVQQALTRTKPESILCAEDLDYQAPLVAFLAGPDAIKKQALKWGALIGTGLGVVGGGIGVAVMASRENAAMTIGKGLGIVAACAGGGALLGALFGWLNGNEAARNQAWVNKNVFEMMDLTSPTATLGQGNKALKEETGDSFSHRLARNESRRRDERTQQMILENQLLTITN